MSIKPSLRISPTVNLNPKLFIPSKIWEEEEIELFRSRNNPPSAKINTTRIARRFHSYDTNKRRSKYV